MSAPEHIPLYMDWSFWTVFFAFLAIVLSQIPPIYLLFRPRKIEVEVHSRIHITHRIGNPNMALVISIRNTGGRELRIHGLSISLSRDGQELGSFPAQNYYETGASQASVLFVPFYLKPSEYWTHSVSFLKLFDRPTEKLYRENQSALNTNIQQKIDIRPENNAHEMVVADEQFVLPFVEIFNKHFIWESGEYVITLAVKTDPSSASYLKRYRFTLYESDTSELRKHVDDYKYGGGISFNMDTHTGLTVPLIEY